MTDKPEIVRGPNELKWKALVAERGDQDDGINLAMSGATSTFVRLHDRSPRWDDTEGWEKLYRLALDNHTELVKL
jgi:hypothetical protein